VSEHLSAECCFSSDVAFVDQWQFPTGASFQQQGLRLPLLLLQYGTGGNCPGYLPVSLLVAFLVA
jgi:hypothetical protein